MLPSPCVPYERRGHRGPQVVLNEAQQPFAAHEVGALATTHVLHVAAHVFGAMARPDANDEGVAIRAASTASRHRIEVAHAVRSAIEGEREDRVAHIDLVIVSQLLPGDGCAIDARPVQAVEVLDPEITVDAADPGVVSRDLAVV